MLDTRLLEAENTRNWSKGFMKFVRIMALHTTPAGKIVLDQKELANKVGVQSQTIRKYFKIAIRDNLVAIKGQTYIFRFPIHFDNFDKGYVPHFSFLESDEFAALSPFAQRFICHALAKGVHNGRVLSIPFKALYSSTFNKGLFNCRSVKEALSDIESIENFLEIDVDRHNREVIVKGLAKNLSLEKYTNVSQGIEIKKLAKAYFQHHNLTEEAITSILEVKRGYANKYGIEYSEKLFEKALPRLFNNPIFHKAVEEHSVGPLLQTICSHVSDEYPHLLQQCIEHEYTELKELESSLKTYREQGLYRFVRNLKDKIINRVKEMKQRYYELLTVSYKSELQKDMELIRSVIRAIKSDCPTSIFDEPVRTVKSNASIDFPFYNWLEG